MTKAASTRNGGTVGASLVARAIANWSHVSDRAFRVLVKMALTAKDNATRDVPANLYFAGHDGLLMALDFKDGTKLDSRLRAVRLAVDELEEVGAVVCTQRALSGGNAVYLLTLDAVAKPRRVKPKTFIPIPKQAENRNPPEAENENPPGPENRNPPQAENRNPPYKEPLEEPLKERAKENGVGVRADVAVVDKSEFVEDLPPPKCPEPTCAKGFVLIGDPPRIQHCPSCNSNVIPFPRRTA